MHNGPWKYEIRYVESERLWMALLVEVHRISIADHDRVLGDELPLVCKVLRHSMRRPEPERIVDAFDLRLHFSSNSCKEWEHTTDLFDDGAAVRQVGLVLDGGEAIMPHHAVELFLGLLLDGGICGYEGREPLHDARGL